MAARIAIIAMTTNSSIKVKPALLDWHSRRELLIKLHDNLFIFNNHDWLDYTVTEIIPGSRPCLLPENLRMLIELAHGKTGLFPRRDR
jgi:hypothetical protein